MKTVHEEILSYMTLTQNHGQVGYPMLNEAMEISWYKLFKKTKESFVSKWVYVTKGKAKMPRTLEKLHGVFVFNHCGDLVPLYEDLLKNILPPMADKCSCNSCDHSTCLCGQIEKDNISLVDVVIDGTPYQNKYLTRVLKNGDVVQEKNEWIPSFDGNGNFVSAKEVKSQTTKCNVQVKPCGCAVNTEENTQKLLSCGCIKYSCAPYLRKQYPALYNNIGYYKINDITREIHLFDNEGLESTLTQVMLSYQSNGADMLVPEYAKGALMALLDWVKKQYSPSYSIPEKRDAKRNYNWWMHELRKELHPIPYQFASEVDDPFAKMYYGGAHPDFTQNISASSPVVCNTGNSSAGVGGTTVNNYYSTGGGGSSGTFLKRIVDGSDDDSPVGDTNTYQNDLLKTLGNFSEDRVEIVVAGVEMYNWGDNASFSLNKSTGTITFTNGYVWQPGTSLKIDLRQ